MSQKRRLLNLPISRQERRPRSSLTRLLCRSCCQERLVLKLSITESDARQHGIYLFYIITKSLFYFKIFQHNAKAALLPRLLHEKKAIWRDLWSIQNEAISLVAMRSKELCLVEKNRATVKPDLSVAPLWMKTHSESRIELRNPQILKKMLEKSSQFLPSEQPLGAEKLGRCPENYRSWKKITLGKLVVTVNLEAIWSEFWMKGA